MSSLTILSSLVLTSHSFHPSEFEPQLSTSDSTSNLIYIQFNIWSMSDLTSNLISDLTFDTISQILLSFCWFFRGPLGPDFYWSKMQEMCMVFATFACVIPCALWAQIKPSSPSPSGPKSIKNLQHSPQQLFRSLDELFDTANWNNKIALLSTYLVFVIKAQPKKDQDIRLLILVTQ